MQRKYEAISAMLLAGIGLVLTIAIVQANGKLLWDAAGVPVSAAANDQRYPRIVSDGSEWRSHRVAGHAVREIIRHLCSTHLPKWAGSVNDRWCFNIGRCE